MNLGRRGKDIGRRPVLDRATAEKISGGKYLDGDEGHAYVLICLLLHLSNPFGPPCTAGLFFTQQPPLFLAERVSTFQHVPL
jgi:hypothetical protein